MLNYVYGYRSYPWMERERVEFKSQIRVFAIFRTTFLSLYHHQNRYSGELSFIHFFNKFQFLSKHFSDVTRT